MDSIIDEFLDPDSPFSVPGNITEIPHPLNSPTAPVCTTNGVTPANLILGIGLTLGSVISYAPQYYAIWKRKSTEGISVSTISLGICATSGVWLNYMYLKLKTKIACCQRDGVGKCFAHALDGFQVAMMAICVWIWCAMWIWYYRVDEGPEVARTPKELKSRAFLKRVVRVFLFAAITFVFLNITIATLMNTVWKLFNVAGWIGFLFGIFSTVTVILKWAPQIWKTFRRKAVGNLSVLMLAMQLPGNLLVVYFQGVVNRAHWSTVLPYAVSAVEFAILLALCLYFIIRDWWRSRQAAKYSLLPSGDDDSNSGDLRTINGSRDTESQTRHSHEYESHLEWDAGEQNELSPVLGFDSESENSQNNLTREE